MDPIVECLIQFRKESGFSREKIAESAGMSVKTYQRIERGETDLKLSQYRSILRTLNLAPLDLALAELGHRSVDCGDLTAASRLLDDEARELLIKFLFQVTKPKKNGFAVDMSKSTAGQVQPSRIQSHAKR